MSCDEVNALLRTIKCLKSSPNAECQALRKQLRAIRSTCAGGYALAIAVIWNRCAAPLGKLANRSLSEPQITTFSSVRTNDAVATREPG